MKIDLPGLGKAVDDLVDRPKRSTAIIQRHIHSIMTKSNNIGSSITCQVGDKPWMLLDAPACTVAEVVDNSSYGPESSIAIVATGDHIGIPEGDDVWPSIARDISEEPEVSIEPPTSASVPEVADTKYGRAKITIAVVEGNIHSRVSKANDITSADVPDVYHEADVFFCAPPSRVGEGGEDHFGSYEGVIAVVGGDPDTIFPEPYNIHRFVSSSIGEQTDVPINRPPSCVETKVFEYGDGVAVNRITHDDNAVPPETDNICDAWRSGGH